jgi:Domain of unknown function (DUF4386)
MRSTLVLAPLFALASSVVAPSFKSDAAEQIAVIAQHPTRWYWFSLLLLVGSILFVPALLSIVEMIRPRAPRLAQVGGALAVLGAVIAVGDVMTQFVSWQMVSGGADQAQMAALLDRFENAGGASIVFTVGGLSILVGCILLTVGLIRHHVAPAWAAVGLSVAVLANIVAFSAASNAGVTASWALLLVSMAAIARPQAASSPSPSRMSSATRSLKGFSRS